MDMIANAVMQSREYNRNVFKQELICILSSFG